MMDFVYADHFDSLQSCCLVQMMGGFANLMRWLLLHICGAGILYYITVSVVVSSLLTSRS